jgi:bifunctional ADP-heptose synthase (sugar kinase/adenylyltransferase)
MAYNLYKNISTATTTVVDSGAGTLDRIIINTTTASTITVYDNTAASGTKIATIAASVPNGTNLVYNLKFNTGLTIVTAGASDITVVYN